MNINSWIPLAAGLAVLLFCARKILNPDASQSHTAWIFPAIASLLFGCFTLYSAVTEGPLGFWVEHVRNFWGNQIWMDLLCSAGVAWFFMVPQAKAHGMRLVPWLIAIVSTGSVGLLAFTARLLYLRDRK